jgi:ubiquinone/menaquinone biosynthesis C-methylase UbiE
VQRLAAASELLDGELEPRLLAGNLRDLARLNRYLGGTDLSWRALLRTQPERAPIRLLDVGTGAADLPAGLLRRAAADRLQLAIEATDIRPEIMAIARQRTTGVPNLTLRLTQPGDLAYPDHAFDIVHSSLLMHHLEPPQAQAMLGRMARVARRAVIVNDLRRGGRWWLAAWLLAHLATGNRYTRHDAPLSVRRAYQPAEVARMAEAAGLRVDAELTDRLGYRFALILRPG